MADGTQRAAILAAINGESGRSAATLSAIFQRLGAIDYTRERAAAFASQALDQLTPLPASPAKESLQQMAAFVVNRAF